MRLSERSKIIVALHSGGLDSSVMLYQLRDEGFNVFPLSILYGQRHNREMVAANKICRIGGFPFKFVDLTNLQDVLKGSSQTDQDIDVPEGHYSADNMAITVVPNRNMMLLSIATAYAVSLGAGWVAYAAHAGDHAQYPDCREVFISAMEKAISLCDDKPPSLIAPFASRSKEDIVRKGSELGVPMRYTYSCYKGGELHCGRCGTCVERAEAFHLAGATDLTPYQDSEYWKTVCNAESKQKVV